MREGYEQISAISIGYFMEMYFVKMIIGESVGNRFLSYGHPYITSCQCDIFQWTSLEMATQLRIYCPLGSVIVLSCSCSDILWFRHNTPRWERLLRRGKMALHKMMVCCKLEYPALKLISPHWTYRTQLSGVVVWNYYLPSPPLSLYEENDQLHRRLQYLFRVVSSPSANFSKENCLKC